MIRIESRYHDGVPWGVLSTLAAINDRVHANKLTREDAVSVASGEVRRWRDGLGASFPDMQYRVVDTDTRRASDCAARTSARASELMSFIEGSGHGGGRGQRRNRAGQREDANRRC